MKLKTVYSYIREMRIKHWVKNLLVFLPAFFGNALTDYSLWITLIFVVLSFSLMSSAIYCINDIHDLDKDRLHPVKKHRPIASGDINVRAASAFSLVLILLSYSFMALAQPVHLVNSLLVLSLYMVVNLFYSVGGLKDHALLDVALLASGFWLRLIIGGTATGVYISEWLHLVVITGSLFMGFGKRRGELRRSDSRTRSVLKSYSSDFLNMAMYVCLTLTIAFFALWCKERGTTLHNGTSFILLVPIFILLCFRYCMDIEGESSDGDPVNVILGDKFCIILAIIFAVILAVFLYF